MNFSELCGRAGFECPGGMQHIEIGGVCTNTAVLQEGELFVCLRGMRTDGHAYLKEAAECGAAAAVIAQADRAHRERIPPLTLTSQALVACPGPAHPHLS